MMYFNVLRPIVSDECYYYFVETDGKLVYEGFELPNELDNLLITDICGGEDGHGCCLYFECVVTQYFRK